MRILLTNDDGIFAPGLAAIYNELVKMGEVTVVAPASSKSGQSHSITIFEPLVCNKVELDGKFTGYSVEGSPADCVKLARMALCEQPPDLVVSGINAGANTGINVYYSGTVAAAMEGAFLEVPAVALSLARDEHMEFEKAAKHCVNVVKSLLPIPVGDVINVNIPRLTKGEPKGIKVVPLSTKGFSEHYIRLKDEKGEMVFQLAGGDHRDDEHLTDSIALYEGYITVTALTSDMTDHETTERLRERELVSKQSPRSLKMAKTKKQKDRQVCIVTVTGVDKVGIIARLATTMAKDNVNIIDVNQKIMEDFFVMTMAADITDAKIGLETIKKHLDAIANDMDLNITIQNEKIFKAMHRI